MGERRGARRYGVYLPLQVFLPKRHSGEYYTANLRDVSRTGIYFQSDVAVGPGTRLELTFALPTGHEAHPSVLIRASAKALRVVPVEGEPRAIYGVAATIDRIDFVRPVVTNAA